MTEIALAYFKKLYFIYGQTTFNFRTNKLYDEWFWGKERTYLRINEYIEFNDVGEMRFLEKFEELL